MIYILVFSACLGDREAQVFVFTLNHQHESDQSDQLQLTFKLHKREFN